MDAHGMNLRVTMQLVVDISISCSGPDQMDARGMRGCVPMQLMVVISICCSGPERTGAHGIVMHIAQQ